MYPGYFTPNFNFIPGVPEFYPDISKCTPQISNSCTPPEFHSDISILRNKGTPPLGGLTPIFQFYGINPKGGNFTPIFQFNVPPKGGGILRNKCTPPYIIGGDGEITLNVLRIIDN